MKQYPVMLSKILEFTPQLGQDAFNYTLFFPFGSFTSYICQLGWLLPQKINTNRMRPTFAWLDSSTSKTMNPQLTPLEQMTSWFTGRRGNSAGMVEFEYDMTKWKVSPCMVMVNMCFSSYLCAGFKKTTVLQVVKGEV